MNASEINTAPAVNLGELARTIAIVLLRDFPKGFDTAELNALVLAAEPSLPKPVIRHHLYKLDKRAPEMFREIKPGVIALVSVGSAA